MSGGSGIGGLGKTAHTRTARSPDRSTGPGASCRSGDLDRDTFPARLVRRLGEAGLRRRVPALEDCPVADLRVTRGPGADCRTRQRRGQAGNTGGGGGWWLGAGEVVVVVGGGGGGDGDGTGEGGGAKGKQRLWDVYSKRQAPFPLGICMHHVVKSGDCQRASRSCIACRRRYGASGAGHGLTHLSVHEAGHSVEVRGGGC